MIKTIRKMEKSPMRGDRQAGKRHFIAYFALFLRFRARPDEKEAAVNPVALEQRGFPRRVEFIIPRKSG